MTILPFDKFESFSRIWLMRSTSVGLPEVSQPISGSQFKAEVRVCFELAVQPGLLVGVAMSMQSAYGGESPIVKLLVNWLYVTPRANIDVVEGPHQCLLDGFSNPHPICLFSAIKKRINFH